MYQQAHNISFDLPDWLEAYCQSYGPGTDLESRMDFVIAASRKNVEQGTGGPFAAAVFEIETGNLVSLGVNLVMTQGMSFLHAEIVALAVAQRKLGCYNLGEVSAAGYELLTSTEPCAMCLGAIPWSGIRRVVAAARDEDARAIGFDEGAKPENWMQALNSRGIDVIADIERESAIAVLQLYNMQEGHIYNAE
jgi:tRNA(Arg) A34 adenosine deaminase TadA